MCIRDSKKISIKVDDCVFVVFADVDQSSTTISSWNIQQSDVTLDVHEVVLLKKFSRLSVDHLKFGDSPVENWDAVLNCWNSVHVDGVDGILAV